MFLMANCYPTGVLSLSITRHLWLKIAKAFDNLHLVAYFDLNTRCYVIIKLYCVVLNKGYYV